MEKATTYRELGDLCRKGEDMPGDHACYLKAKDAFYADRRNQPRKTWKGWWDMPMAVWAWSGDAKALRA